MMASIAVREEDMAVSDQEMALRLRVVGIALGVLQSGAH
jgi:hypothetical protein